MRAPGQTIGALVRRDTMRTLRQDRATLAVGAFAAVALGGVFLALPDTELTIHNAHWAADPMYWVPMTALFLLSLTLVPAQASFAIQSERTYETLDPLRLTLLGDWGIVLAKALSVLVVYFLFTIALLPIFGATFFLIGIDALQLLGGYTIMLGIAAATACTGTYVSTYASRNTVNLVRALISGPLLLSLVGIVCGAGYAGIIARLRASIGGWNPEIIIPQSITVFSPLGSAMFVLNVMPVGLGMVAGSTFTCVLTCVLCLLLARRNLRRAPADPGHQQREPLFVIGKAIEDMERSASYTVRPAPPPTDYSALHAPRALGGLRAAVMALAHKDSLAGGRYWLSAILFGILAAVCLISISQFVWESWTVSLVSVRRMLTAHQLVATVLGAFLCVLGAGFASVLVVQERDSHTLDDLRLTLLDAYSVALGKIGALLRLFLPFLLIAALPLAVGAVGTATAADPWRAGAVVLGLVQVVSVVVLLALCVSCVAQRRMTAVPMALGAGGFYVLGLPWIGAIVGVPWRGGPPPEAVVSSPMLAAVLFGLEDDMDLAQSILCSTTFLAHGILIAVLLVLYFFLMRRVMQHDGVAKS